MIALLTDPKRIESAAFQKRTENDSFSHRVWLLHGVIADPASKAGDVKDAKLSLLRTLTKSRVFERPVGRCTTQSPLSVSYCKDVAERHHRRPGKRVLHLWEHSIMPLRDPLIDRSCFK
jgi:hypothetical protein